RGELVPAIRDFNRAIVEDTSYANAFRNRGLARLQQRSFNLAIADFDEAFRLNRAIGHGIEYAVALSGRDAVPSPIDDSDDSDER
ncbi:MAG TPA: tetratricopeptide repeat protein, partial [Vicinamibacterales bacterium]